LWCRPITIIRTRGAIITETASRPRGGRPRQQDAPLITGRILDAATALFLRDGYGATSLEAVAAMAGVSKRTLYARFAGKAALLQVVVARLVARWLPPFDTGLGQASGLEAALLAAARVMLATALVPEALALHRLIIAEIGRFPELALVLRDAGAGVGVERLSRVLAQAGIADPAWAAEQFMALVLSVPQRRAMGLGGALDAAAQEDWAKGAVALFLRGAAARPEGDRPTPGTAGTTTG
jgi:AcrR family transcriptional regulator